MEITQVAVIEIFDPELVQMARSMAELTSVFPLDDIYEFTVSSGLHDIETVLWMSKRGADMKALLLEAQSQGAARVIIRYG